jgi:predicted AAA+ superfamily ATPase
LGPEDLWEDFCKTLGSHMVNLKGISKNSDFLWASIEDYYKAVPKSWQVPVAGKKNTADCILIANGDASSLLAKCKELKVKKEEEQVKRTITDGSLVKVDKDIEFFFKNTEIFTQYGQPGTRKVMLIGPPGTGKTSMCIKIARQFSKTMPVIVATDLSAVATHLQSCAKSNMRTLVILEDAESCMSGMDGATHSSILNFLDGIDQPVNTKGAYVIMTTNHPERIESRILKRPGRVDRLFQVGELEDHYALQCARLYFGNTLRYTNRTNNGLSKVVNGLTGAEIKELSNSSKAYAAQNGRKLSVTLIKEVRKLLSKDLSDAYRFAEENSLLGKDAESFAQILKSKAVPFEMSVIPNQGHQISEPSAYVGLLSFLDKHLGGHAEASFEEFLEKRETSGRGRK